MTRPTVVEETTKTIVVLGASYAGHRAIQVLLTALPEDVRVVVLERNTHANHIYAFPRVSVVGGHEHKVFIPYTNIFKPAVDKQKHALLHANVVQIDTAKRKIAYRLIDSPTTTSEVTWLEWTFLVYAAGSHLPDPINLWREDKFDGAKSSGVRWLQDAQRRIAASKRILVIGGGALGVQLASDIAVTYGAEKQVALTHSRERLLNRFDPWMHQKAAEELSTLGVELILGSRVDMSSVNAERTSIRLQDGRQLHADLILFCLGQTPNTSLLPSDSLTESGMIDVLPSLQVARYPSIFAIGDAADTFGAINAGHTAWDQAEVAAENIVRLVQAEQKEEIELKEYRPTPPAIKVSLGITRAIRQTMDGQLLQVDNGTVDLNSSTMWTRRGLSTEDMTL